MIRKPTPLRPGVSRQRLVLGLLGAIAVALLLVYSPLRNLHVSVCLRRPTFTAPTTIHGRDPADVQRARDRDAQLVLGIVPEDAVLRIAAPRPAPSNALHFGVAMVVPRDAKPAQVSASAYRGLGLQKSKTWTLFLVGEGWGERDIASAKEQLASHKVDMARVVVATTPLSGAAAANVALDAALADPKVTHIAWLEPYTLWFPEYLEFLEQPYGLYKDAAFVFTQIALTPSNISPAIAPPADLRLDNIMPEACVVPPR